MQPLKRQVDRPKNDPEAPSPKRIKSEDENRCITETVIQAFSNSCRLDGICDKFFFRAFNQEVVKKTPKTFTHTVGFLPKASNQGKSSNCWLHAGLNYLKIKLGVKYKLQKDFDLSINYLSFWDRIEKANLFLNRMIKFMDKDLKDSKVNKLLVDPFKEGSHWNPFVFLVKKYGVIPKAVMPDTNHTGDSDGLNRLLNLMLRKFTLELREKCNSGATKKELFARKKEMLQMIYNYLAQCLGKPPESFDFVYKDGDETISYKTTPVRFFEDIVPGNLDDKIYIANLVSEEISYFQKYCCSKIEKAMAGSEKSVCLNLPYSSIVPSAIDSIKGGDPIYFSCDINQQHYMQSGVLDTDIYNYSSLLGISLKMTKKENLATCESGWNHGMLLCGVKLNKEGKPTHWLALNSWGNQGKNGYLVISQNWFETFTYFFSIDRKYLPEDIVRLL